jgi:hypothetical protein
MILYDGEYSWKGSVDRNERPISWWASNYHLKIVDLGRQPNGVFFLKPVIVKIHDTGQGASVVNCLPEMAKHICAQFELDLNRVLWVEDASDGEAGVQVASFETVATVAGEPLYITDWRPATPGEVDFIRTHFDDPPVGEN